MAPPRMTLRLARRRDTWLPCVLSAYATILSSIIGGAISSGIVLSSISGTVSHSPDKAVAR